VGGDFQANIAVLAFRLIVYRAQNVARVADIRCDQLFVDFGRGASSRGKARDVAVILAAASDRLLEYRGVGGDPPQILVSHSVGKLATRDHVPSQIVHPAALTISEKLF
jgi:hypothetical protein